MQSRHKKSQVSPLGARISFVPRNQPPARLGMQEETGNEEWGKGTGAGQWGLGAPPEPSAKDCSPEKPSRLPATAAGLSFQGGFP